MWWSINVVFCKKGTGQNHNCSIKIEIYSTDVWCISGNILSQIFSATCKAPNQRVEINYYDFPPYIYTTSSNNNNNKQQTAQIVEGLVVELATEAIRHCTHICSAFNNSKVDVKYKRIEQANVSTIDATFATQGSSAFLLPRVVSGGGGSVYDLIQSVGPVLIEVPPTDAEQQKTREILFKSSVLKLYPVCVLFFLFNCIMGCIFWFIVSIIRIPVTFFYFYKRKLLIVRSNFDVICIYWILVHVL